MITVYFHLDIKTRFGASRADDAKSKWSQSASKEMLDLQVYIEKLYFLNTGQMMVKLNWNRYSSQNESWSPGTRPRGAVSRWARKSYSCKASGLTNMEILKMKLTEEWISRTVRSKGKLLIHETVGFKLLKRPNSRQRLYKRLKYSHSMNK